jgi:hypothetical protein
LAGGLFHLPSEQDFLLIHGQFILLSRSLAAVLGNAQPDFGAGVLV